MGERRMNYFKEAIYDWQSWANVYQSIPAFSALIKEIWKENKWTMAPIEHCQAGTNAVFKIGDKIIKLFAPIESGCDTQYDYENEIRGLTYAQTFIPTASILVKGVKKDRYLFRYLVLKVIEGKPFSTVMNDFDPLTKKRLGKQLRDLTNQLNQSSEVLKPTDYLEKARNNTRWSLFPRSFQEERLSFIEELNSSPLVYVHGDLNGDNILIDQYDNMHIIDFADALMAPIEYEWSLIICELFQFDFNYLIGYFGYLPLEEYLDICLNGLLIHDFGANIIHDCFGKVEDISNIEGLYSRLKEKLEENFRK